MIIGPNMKSIKNIIKEMHAQASDQGSNLENLFGQMYNSVNGIDDKDIKVELDIEVEDTDAENFQGDIREIDDAELVYKREQPDGNYNELWILNVGKDFDNTYQIQRDILAGTDIDPGHLQSEDGSQQLELYSVGNIQYMFVTGMPH
jgi:hypothetical protein